MSCIQHYDSPLGRITLAAEGNALTGLWFEEQACREAMPEEYEGTSQPVLRETILWLDLYFEGRDPGFTPKLNPRGTEFRKKVWKELLGIHYGRTVTYGKIAEQLDLSPRAARAVGNAAAHNPILLIIPCHRVIGADGSLTGYAGGMKRKEKLLRLEGIIRF